MKIIDLLNKIANGEEVPKRIKYCGAIYEKYDYNNKYYDIDINGKEKDILSEHLASESFYNDEVEILEEEKKIPEKLTDILRVDDLIPPVDENMYKIWTQTIKNQNKINEIINYLKSKGE